MKMNKLTTAIAVSMPLLFGAAHAQTTTSPDTGMNRSSDAGAMNSNPTPATGSSNSAASGNTATSGNAGNAGSPTNSGASGTTGSASGGTGAAGGNTTSTTGGGVPTGTGAGAATGTSAGAGTAAGGAAAGGAASTMPGQGTAGDAASRSPGATAAGGGDAAASTEAITGWSLKDDIMGKAVHNENDEKVGDVNDVVVSSDGRNMYLLIGAGGFLGMGEKNVAVPFDRFNRSENRILLSGYSKEQLKALPEVQTERR